MTGELVSYVSASGVVYTERVESQLSQDDSIRRLQKTNASMVNACVELGLLPSEYRIDMRQFDHDMDGGTRIRGYLRSARRLASRALARPRHHRPARASSHFAWPDSEWFPKPKRDAKPGRSKRIRKHRRGSGPNLRDEGTRVDKPGG